MTIPNLFRFSLLLTAGLLLATPERAQAAPCMTYADTDLDGYGAGALTINCPGPGWVLNDSDCDDADSASFPGATEVVDDGVDQDCTGGDTCYQDGDGDGYRPGTGMATTPSMDLDCFD